MKFRTLIKELAPPIIIRLLKSLTKKNEKCFSGVYSSFDEVPDDKPWDSGFWIDISRDKLNKFNNVGNSNEFIPTDYLHRQRHLKLCQIVNMISQNEVCKILDFAGGTGFVYFLINLLACLSFHLLFMKHLILKLMICLHQQLFFL